MFFGSEMFVLWMSVWGFDVVVIGIVYVSLVNLIIVGFMILFWLKLWKRI